LLFAILGDALNAFSILSRSLGGRTFSAHGA
jgi:hypothetical protein